MFFKIKGNQRKRLPYRNLLIVVLLFSATVNCLSNSWANLRICRNIQTLSIMPGEKFTPLGIAKIQIGSLHNGIAGIWAILAVVFFIFSLNYILQLQKKQKNDKNGKDI